MSFRFHPDAERELREAVEYYEDIEPGLGYDLSVEVYSAIQRAVAYPRTWPVLEVELPACFGSKVPVWGALLRERRRTADHCGNEPSSGAGLLERSPVNYKSGKEEVI